MRVPFPFRVLLSYLLVLIVGSLPTYIYLEVLFQERLASYEVKQLVRRIQRLATQLPDLSDTQKVAALQKLSHVMSERVTLINAKGRVLFDSSIKKIKKMDNHIKRLEVQVALGNRKPEVACDPKILGIGVSRRISKNTNRNSLYVAIRILRQSGKKSGVLRISIPTTRINALKNLLIQVFRNSLASAISVALVLSLLSAFVFVRPLQRVAEAAKGLVEGDYTISLKKLGNDEIGDVGRSLQQLSVELRRRLALAEASDVLLLQMVEVVPMPLVVFDDGGHIRAINGSSRRLFETRSEDATEILSRWLDSSSFKKVWTDAVRSQLPQEVTLTLSRGETVYGIVHLIQHPSGASFGTFIGASRQLKKRSFLPRPSEVKPTQLKVLIEQSLRNVNPLLERLDIAVVWEKDVEPIVLAEVQRRLMLSLSAALQGASSLAKEGEQIGLHFEDIPLYMEVVIEAKVPSFSTEIVRQMITPIGGSVTAEANEFKLQWPKA